MDMISALNLPVDSMILLLIKVLGSQSVEVSKHIYII